MKGIILEKPGGEYTLSDSVDQPKPGKSQILVKSLVAGLNPVEDFQKNGVLVSGWPIVLGCDASGIVTDVGEDVKRFKKGDSVFGCPRLGEPGYGTFQEYFLMDEHLTFKKPANITTAQAATIGVGLLTASLGLVHGMRLPLESQPQKDDKDSEWIIVFGATGSVGQYGVQLGKLIGYKVLAFCSPSNNKLVESLGADATLSHREPLEEQLKGITTITGGKFARIFDASGLAAQTGMQALADLSNITDSSKYFATTNDWVPIDPREGVEIEPLALGLIGKSGDAHAETVTKNIASDIPKLEKFLESGALKPNEYEQVGGTGIEGILEGLTAFNTRKSDGKKLVVEIAAN